MKKRKKWLPIAIVAVVVVLGIGAFVMVTHNEKPTLSVSEMKTRAGSLDGQSVLLKGEVIPGSLQWDQRSQVMHFDLGDGVERQAVTFNGVVPDKFRVGATVTVEGQLQGGNFEAQRFNTRSLCNVCH